MNKNKYGLSRNIPYEIKREIRNNSGFGCIICGCAIGTYEHVDPEFKKAEEHDPSKMTYLCATHHDKVTRGLLSKDTIKLIMKNPWSKKKDKCHDAFDIDSEEAYVQLGGTNFFNVHILSIDDIPILSILPPRTKNKPYILNGKFCDLNGKLCLKILENEWIAFANNIWDMEIKGKRLTIKSSHKKIALQIFCDPPNGIIIEKLNMNYKNMNVLGSQDLLELYSGGDSCKFKINFKCIQSKSEEPHKALQFFSNGDLHIGKLKFNGFYGGGTIKLEGKGAILNI